MQRLKKKIGRARNFRDINFYSKPTQIFLKTRPLVFYDAP